MARATVTKRFELSEEAAGELERRAKLCGMSQTAFVQDLIMCGAVHPVDSTSARPHNGQVDNSFDPEMIAPESVSSLSDEAKQARAKTKAEKAGRKADLARSITDARLLGPTSCNHPAKAALVETVKDALPATIDPLSQGRMAENLSRRITEAVCSHRAASRTTGKNWKCTACGYQHE